MRSLLAVSLLINGAPGGPQSLRPVPQAFGVIDRGRGLLLAAMAGLAFSSAQTHESKSAGPPISMPRWPPGKSLVRPKGSSWSVSVLLQTRPSTSSGGLPIPEP
jgi:hypothetical protein